MLSIPERRALRLDVRDALAHAISSGQIKPGERIVESRIARELGVSQTTVREAIRDLEGVGLVTCAIHRGCVVRALSLADVAEMYEMRALLEGEAARLAATKLGAEDLGKLDELARDMIYLAEAGETTAMIDLDVRFHETIMATADHGLLLRLWSLIHPSFWTHLAVVTILGLSLEAVARRHLELVAALRSGDPRSARAALQRHHLDLRDQALRQLAELDATTATVNRGVADGYSIGQQ